MGRIWQGKHTTIIACQSFLVLPASASPVFAQDPGPAAAAKETVVLACHAWLSIGNGPPVGSCPPVGRREGKELCEWWVVVVVVVKGGR